MIPMVLMATLLADEEPTGWAGVETAAPNASFFEKCAFVSIDFQEGPKPGRITEATLSPPFQRAGFTVESVNAAIDFEFDVARPNAKKVADACRALGLPMVFVHWGYQFKDGMDLDPQTRNTFLLDMGTDYEKWPHHISCPSSRPSAFFEVRDGEYVIAKTAQDAFSSSNLHFVLQNLGVERIVFIGGHTAGCLGGSAKHAKRLRYQTLCVMDATFDAAESRRPEGIRDSGYDYVISTETFLKLAEGAKE